jgi:hypothetical protein
MPKAGPPKAENSKQIRMTPYKCCAFYGAGQNSNTPNRNPFPRVDPLLAVSYSQDLERVRSNLFQKSVLNIRISILFRISDLGFRISER